MHFEWDELKNKQLKTNRANCFEDVFIAISEERLLDILPHHNPVKFPNQKFFIVRIGGYVYYVHLKEMKKPFF